MASILWIFKEEILIYSKISTKHGLLMGLKGNYALRFEIREYSI